jgi:hypothetical protein
VPYIYEYQRACIISLWIWQCGHSESWDRTYVHEITPPPHCIPALGVKLLGDAKGGWELQDVSADCKLRPHAV